jgi:hypothetical protein
MSTRVVDSEWRENRVLWYGKPIREFIGQYKPGEMFTIRQVASQADCFENLSERYAYDVTVAVLYDLQLQKVLMRQGRSYCFPYLVRRLKNGKKLKKR